MLYLVYRHTERVLKERMFSSVPELLYIVDDLADAVSYIKEKCIMWLTENVGGPLRETNDYYILCTEFGPFEPVELCEDSETCIRFENKNYDLGREEPFTLEDFRVDRDELNVLDENLEEYIKVLNERLEKQKKVYEQVANVDKDSEIYKRYVADKNAYLLMKRDGLAPPNPAFAHWSLEKLQEMTFEEYRNNKPRSQGSSEYSSLFF